ncbi:MAG: TetR/AcrR family transcriptional regulator, partial [Conexibacter sp.]|nr:TetR/AcrR family transcriptional regulator [Conexibacter sp.]
LDAVTLARVAAALGVKPPSLYNHVNGRDGLLRGVALLALGELAAALREAAIGRSGADGLQATAQAYRTYVLEHPGRYAAGGITAPAADDTELQTAGAIVLDVLRGVLRSWSLDDEQTIHALRGLRAAVHGFASLEAASGFGFKLDLDTSFEHLIAALAAGFGRAG